MSRFLELALSYVARGWYVFPCWPKTKKPMTPRGFKDATLDVEQIKAWWAKTPEANVAIACGVSDIAVLDCDHGLEDDNAALTWLGRNGIPSTYMVRTGRRPEFGLQVYFSVAIPDVGLWKLDGCEGQIKSLGGYVMAAGSIHPQSGQAYTVKNDAALAPTPDVVRALRKIALAVKAGPMEKIAEGAGRHDGLTSVAGKLRASGLDGDAIYEALTPINEALCEVPVSDADVKNIAYGVARRYPVAEITGTVTIGGKAPLPGSPVLADDIEIVEELDASLTATPLPIYPHKVWDGTLYGDFAGRAAAGNFVPLEFFIEGALTYAGAVASNRLRGMTEEITSRLYTVLLGVAGIGKGTTFRRIRKFVPPTRLLNDVPDKVIPPGCSVLMDRAGSEPGLNDALLKHASVIEDFEEMDRLMEKTTIQGSGNALMSIIRSCFDDVVPGITTTGQRKVAASLAYLSLLGAMTPSLWRKAMEGRDTYGSGLGGRFNLVATNEERTASTLTDMDIGNLNDLMECRFSSLECGDLVIPTEKAALELLHVWWNDKAQGKAYYNRVNVISHRKALHIAWMKDSPVITAEIMADALQLGEYLVGVREAFSVVKGEDKTAINENKVLCVLKNVSPRAVRSSQMVKLLDGLVSRATVYRALESLTDSGEVEKFSRRPDATSKSAYAIYRAILK